MVAAEVAGQRCRRSADIEIVKHAPRSSPVPQRLSGIGRKRRAWAFGTRASSRASRRARRMARRRRSVMRPCRRRTAACAFSRIVSNTGAKIAGRSVDHLQHLSRRGLLLQRLPAARSAAAHSPSRSPPGPRSFPTVQFPLSENASNLLAIEREQPERIFVLHATAPEGPSVRRQDRPWRAVPGSPICRHRSP